MQATVVLCSVSIFSSFMTPKSIFCRLVVNLCWFALIFTLVGVVFFAEFKNTKIEIFWPCLTCEIFKLYDFHIELEIDLFITIIIMISINSSAVLCADSESILIDRNQPKSTWIDYMSSKNIVDFEGFKWSIPCESPSASICIDFGWAV